MCDIAFKCGNTSIPRDASAEVLATATAATLRLSNQKNGIRESMIHCSTIESVYCPAKTLIRRFLHMYNNNAKLDDIISSFWDHLGKCNVTDDDMRVAIRRAVIMLGLSKNGILRSRVGSHSFQAGEEQWRSRCQVVTETTLKNGEV